MDSCEIEDNNAVESELKRIFPEYFSKFSLPEGAHEERILVYRACKTNKCDKKSFTPTYEEQGCQVRDCDDPTDPSLYSLSTLLILHKSYTSTILGVIPRGKSLPRQGFYCFYDTPR